MCSFEKTDDAGVFWRILWLKKAALFSEARELCLYCNLLLSMCLWLEKLVLYRENIVLLRRVGYNITLLKRWWAKQFEHLDVSVFCLFCFTVDILQTVSWSFSWICFCLFLYTGTILVSSNIFIVCTWSNKGPQYYCNTDTQPAQCSFSSAPKSFTVLYICCILRHSFIL